MPRTRLALVFAAALFLAATAAHSQTLTNTYSYDFPSSGLLGGNPYGNFIQASDGNIYGTLLAGGANGIDAGGAIFQIVPSTGAYSLIYSCAADGSDCNGPASLLQLPDGNLYGISSTGCTYNYGCIFSVALNGTGYTILHAFSNTADGECPNGNIIFDGTNIYGTNLGSMQCGIYQTGDINPYGNAWIYQPDLGLGFTSFTGLLSYSTSDSEGYGPVAGLTVVDGVFYGVNQVGGSAGYGTLFSYDRSSNTTAVLHNFANGTDGAFPSSSPKLYSDSNLYGTTIQNGSGPDYGSVWKSGLTSGYSTIYTFTGSTKEQPFWPIAFDTAGNVVFIAQGDGSNIANNPGEIYLEPHAGGTVKTLYSFLQGSALGDRPDAGPFFDNQGHLWTSELVGGTNGVGSVDEWTLSTETKAPITITASPATVLANGSSTITWSTNNSFSDTEQYCFGMGNGDTGWDGIQQVGKYSSGVLTGTYTAKPTAAGSYVYTIVCGGSESASVTLTAQASAAATTTTLSATPNPVGIGSNVTLSATVKKTSGTGAPTGKVTFQSGTTVLNTVTLNGSGVAAFTASTTGFAAGTYPVVASYGGDAEDLASTSSAVNVVLLNKTTTALTAAPNPVPADGTVTLTATVTATSGTATGNVAFKVGTTTLATVALNKGKAVLTASTSAYTAGTYPVYAVYAGNSSDAGSTSSTVNVVLQ